MSTPTGNSTYRFITIRVGNQNMIPASTPKYLAIIIVKNARRTRHVDHIIHKSASALGMLRPILQKVGGRRKHKHQNVMLQTIDKTHSHVHLGTLVERFVKSNGRDPPSKKEMHQALHQLLRITQILLERRAVSKSHNRADRRIHCLTISLSKAG